MSSRFHRFVLGLTVLSVWGCGHRVSPSLPIAVPILKDLKPVKTHITGADSYYIFQLDGPYDQCAVEFQSAFSDASWHVHRFPDGSFEFSQPQPGYTACSVKLFMGDLSSKPDVPFAPGGKSLAYLYLRK